MDTMHPTPQMDDNPSIKEEPVDDVTEANEAGSDSGSVMHIADTPTSDLLPAGLAESEPAPLDLYLGTPSSPNLLPSVEEGREPSVKPDPGPPGPSGPSNSLRDALPIQETRHLKHLASHDVPEVLEAGVQTALRLLEQLRPPLAELSTPDSETWSKAIDNLKDRATPTRTVVGVLGNTGTGKSSVINALLDEERLLPTNCLRACTASPTEISYNYSDDPTCLYRAEIEFISPDDWIREMRILFTDLLDGGGEVSHEATSNADSEAGIAYAKLKAVYPQKTRDMLAQASPESFADEPAVRTILGSVKKIEDRSAAAIYSRLQHYVDSKEKLGGTVDHRKKKGVSMEYWPLIKVVRIYTKADALSTGAVIVDLPGVQDSNAARSAVAMNYRKSCTSLWIVAPITRAVDDKTAKTLLGDSFKRQLKYDGTYSAVTFICSKTDDISITEAADSLHLEEEIAALWNEAERKDKDNKDLKDELRTLNEAKAAYGEQLDDCEARADTWEDLQDMFSQGETVYAPSENPQKRKRSGARFRARKHAQSSDIDDDDSYSEADSNDEDNSQPCEHRLPLSKVQIEQTLASLKSQRKKIREEIRELGGRTMKIREESKRLQTKREELLAETKAICIKGRNEYSRRAIQHDFAMGIKELDQENAVEEDDTAFDPDQDTRDYDEIARTLPVFCVSSRAYQKLRERLKKDDFRSDGFLTADDTEVPQLQAHAKKLTEARRAAHCRSILNDLMQLLNSMKLWVVNGGSQSMLTDVEQRTEMLHLNNLLDGLEKGFESSVRDCIALMKQALTKNIFKRFNSSIPRAVHKAVDTANGWAAPKSHGGLLWSTYKATVRRSGVFHGAAGPRDFNAELFEPISRNLVSGWARAFQQRLPAILAEFADKTKKQLHDFDQVAQARARLRNTEVPGLFTLSDQIKVHVTSLEALPAVLRETITELQREASRQFTPQIMESMRQAYSLCTEESGPGSYNRMKTIMVDYVEGERHVMFQQATDLVKEQLEDMCLQVRKQMNEWIDDLFDGVSRDYMQVLVGTTVNGVSSLSEEELALRVQINAVLQGADAMFKLSDSEPSEAILDDVLAMMRTEPEVKLERDTEMTDRRGDTPSAAMNGDTMEDEAQSEEGRESFTDPAMG
ncbi:hypothetical protein F4778DRAFT_69364 [Xylariomycetidae sp. FL2044]|nr:hypothetical protein F4778DRAFT_69364 [Xylariomycetidae sp. FL2044]